jgi:hypothetical protein
VSIACQRSPLADSVLFGLQGCEGIELAGEISARGRGSGGMFGNCEVLGEEVPPYRFG